MNPAAPYVVLFSESLMPISFSHDFLSRITGPGSQCSSFCSTCIFPPVPLEVEPHQIHLLPLGPWRCLRVGEWMQSEP